MAWYQRQIVLPQFSPGLHPITQQVVEAMPEIGRVRVGLLNLFLQHTSASLTINENADPDVVADLARSLDRLAPENFRYQHTVEGPDDMPGHIKATLTGVSLVVPVENGRLALGTWQGIFLCEHRRQGGRRRLLLTLQGEMEP
jgi:secondary thiamine-phosphate synthase enzyme